MTPGVDVVAIDRLARALARTPALAHRVFTEVELADAARGDVGLDSAVASSRLAARFAAKEAYRKAAGRPCRWRDVEVVTDADGAPRLRVRGAATRAAVSLSHDGGVAVAFVLLDEE